MEVMQMLLLIFTVCLITEVLIADASLVVNSDNCAVRCGDNNVSIPFPFGVQKGCYLNEGFAVTCNDSSGTLKPVLSSVNMELLGVSMTGQVLVRNPVISSNCDYTYRGTGVDIQASPFTYSDTHNRYTAIGCINFARLSMNGNLIGGCMSICNGTNAGCYGLNCCQTTIPPRMKSFTATVGSVVNTTNGTSNGECRSAFMVDQEWFNSYYSESFDVLPEKGYVPAVLQWGAFQGYCSIPQTSAIFCSDNGFCWSNISQNHLCVCASSSNQYESTSYINDLGCPGCMNQDRFGCRLLCMDDRGSNNCSCPDGYSKTGFDNNCIRMIDFMESKKSRAKVILIGCASGLGLLLLLIGTWWLYNTIKRRNAIKLKQKFFERNGGLLLQQQLSSSENGIEQTKLFASSELEKATDHFHVNRMLGQGGQGTVYKGMLTDGRIVAVKKSKAVDEDKLEQFINEVVILSQVNHRNVVKLFGCCLETDVPLLVYEFIPNGTLFQYIHDQNEEFLLTWEMRLRIAIEVADALSYLHSAASFPIYHRDIKSSNILLDDKFRAKVSDFGTSKSIAIDQTHVTTRVQGTFGYLDPEYFQSSQFTEKSDVYSFGVVLVELLTGQKAISAVRSAEQRSLASYFLVSMEEDRLFDILDTRVIKEGKKEEIMAVAKLAQRCLNLNGKNRPTMKAVAMELERIRESEGASTTTTTNHQFYEEFDYSVNNGATGPWDTSSASTGSSLNSRVVVPIDVQPLLPRI